MTREEAKEAIKEAYGNSEYTDEIIKALEQEPKTGYWIIRHDGFRCSKCLIVHSHTSIFCPSCGAKMIEPQESEE